MAEVETMQAKGESMGPLQQQPELEEHPAEPETNGRWPADDLIDHLALRGRARQTHDGQAQRQTAAVNKHAAKMVAVQHESKNFPTCCADETAGVCAYCRCHPYCRIV
eukprot:737804-Pyramimonas_sp.AAC.1